MIRHARGDWYLLIRQHDHALLSGKFAERSATRLFAPRPRFWKASTGSRCTTGRLAGAR
jgi:hypothetical protein